RRAKGNRWVTGPESVRHGPFLLGTRQQILDVRVRGLFDFRSDPLPLDDADGMIAPERALFGINGDDWERELIRLRVARLDDHALVEHRRAQIAGAVLEHLPAEEPRGAAVVNDALLDTLDERARGGLSNVVQRERGDLARSRIGLCEQRDEAAIARARVRMSEPETPPLGVAICRPAFGPPREVDHVPPADRPPAPADGFR